PCPGGLRRLRGCPEQGTGPVQRCSGRPCVSRLSAGPARSTIVVTGGAGLSACTDSTGRGIAPGRTRQPGGGCRSEAAAGALCDVSARTATTDVVIPRKRRRKTVGGGLGSEHRTDSDKTQEDRRHFAAVRRGTVVRWLRVVRFGPDCPSAS